MAYISAKEFSERKGKGYTRVRELCREGRIKGARYVGTGNRGTWLIPENAEYPSKRKEVRA
jgi:hypothetical protein